MGEVYEAYDEVLRSHVALKTILPQFAEDPALLERFRREVLLARKVSHPNVCRIYELYSSKASGEPLHFLTMEFLEGETLHERLLRQGRMVASEVLPLLKQMAAGLDAAHAEGVVHRDFKTSNVMLVARKAGETASGEMRAVVTDFGIARAVHADSGAAEKVTGTGLLGTPEYMAPEQVTGAAIGPAADIYALGLVLYEMLTGKTPFQGATPLEIAVKRVNERPPPPKSAVPELPERWNAAVLKCLEREPSRRFSSAAGLLHFLEQPVAMVRRGRVVSLAIVAAVAVVLVAVGAAWWGGLFGRRHNERWLREDGIPELHRLVDADKLMEAELLALEASRLLPGNPALTAVWRTFAKQVTLASVPPGARVSFREYDGTDPAWHELGTTPLTLLYPRGAYRLRFELEGYRPYEAAGDYWSTSAYPLDKVGALPDDLLHVPGGKFGPGEEGQEEELSDYFIDRYEVTNRRYKAFVDAGGYKRPEFWKYPFVKDKRQLTFSQALSQFTDKTGRPGPSTWELSSYPQGQENYPVGGVSWYEAAAFAAFEGRDLPTTYHWSRAAGKRLARWMVLASNFDGKGPVPVGQSKAISRFGASDMAGNVREWCLNELTGRGGVRVIAGGGWNDPTYSFMDTAGQPPWDRSPTNGLRLVTYPTKDANLDHARQPVVFEFRDYSKEKPVGDAEFRIYQRLYAYDHQPLNAVIERTDPAPDWTRERITFDAAYGKERMVAYLYLPKGGKPPYQPVVYFPGSNALFLHTIDEDVGFWDFIVRSGRAFIYPMYKGTFERQSDIKSDVATGSVAYRDAVVQWVQDLSRSIDYLDTREDIDHKRLGYFGVSWGAAMGGLIPAVEPRIRAAVLDVAGLEFGRPLPEADVFNFLPRVKIPMLMLNGRYDEYFPIETSQNPMFQNLGTPGSQKRHVIYEAGHFVPRVQLIQETIDWYDRYLGPVSGPKPGAK